jgi:hypothetical protein
MPAPPSREILGARDSDPAREGTRRDLPLLARDAEHAHHIEGMADDRRFSDKAVFRQVCPDRNRWMVEIGALADIERRMGIENLQSAHQEKREADDIDPMRDAHQRGMTAVPALGERPIGGGHGGHIILRRFGHAARWAHILRVLVNSEVCALLTNEVISGVITG